MRLILNCLWLVFSDWLAISYLLAGVVMCMLIVTIPFGVAAFRLAFFVVWPFGRTVIRRDDAGSASMIGNALWFMLVGVWLALAHALLGIVLCLTVVGIPLGLGNFKLAAVAIAPLGKEIVSTSDPRAAAGMITF